MKQDNKRPYERPRTEVYESETRTQLLYASGKHHQYPSQEW